MVDFNGVHILEGSESGFLKAMARELCVHQGLTIEEAMETAIEFLVHFHETISELEKNS